MISACRGPHAMWAFGGVSFLESSLMAVPIDLAMVPLGLARPHQLWLIALVGTLGSLVGALLGYLVGFFAFEAVGAWMLDLYGATDAFMAFREEFQDKAWIAVAAAALTPVPFQFGALLAGAISMPLHVFLAVAFAARLFRFSMMALMIRLFGAGINAAMNRYPNTTVWLAIAATVIGVAMVPILLG